MIGGKIPAIFIPGGNVRGNQFLCPCEPLRGRAEAPHGRMRSVQLVRFDPKQSRAEKMGLGKSACCPPGSPVPRAGPASCQASQLEHWSAVVLAWPGQPRMASGLGGPPQGQLAFPAFPQLSPAEQSTHSAFTMPPGLLKSAPTACSAPLRTWLMGRIVARDWRCMLRKLGL